MHEFTINAHSVTQTTTSTRQTHKAGFVATIEVVRLAGRALEEAESWLDSDLIALGEGAGRFAPDFQHRAAELVPEATGGCFSGYGVGVPGHGDEGRGAVFVEVRAAYAHEGWLAG